MAVFVALAALLVLGTLAWTLHPLWRTRPLPAIALIAGIALGTGALYRTVGTPAALDPVASAPPATMREAIARLEAELQRDPAQVEGQRLLARAYQQQGLAEKARDRFARAAALAPDDPDLLVEAAESRALADPQRRFDPQAMALLQQALKLQPMHQRGRWFLGIAQRQQGRDADAVATWEPLLAVVDANTASALRPQIDVARKTAGLPPATAAVTPASSGALTVKIALDPDFAARVRLRGDTSVFVIARIPGGPPMPVAVEKHTLQDLPLTVTLDDGDGPMPTAKLSALKEVEVLARLSASGNAMRAEGDIESALVRVKLPAKAPVELAIGAIKP